MAWVNPRIAQIVAQQPEVVAAVRKVRDEVAETAEALFASHDRPGRHEITTQDEKIDSLVSLDGPAPAAVEFGHWAGKGANHRFVEGLHILGRAVAEAEARGRL